MTFLNIAGDWRSSTPVTVTSVEQLRNLLTPLSDKVPGIVNLEIKSKGLLQLGLGGSFACAQFTTIDVKPRYLSAKASEIRAKADVDFLCGGTPTPISPELCIQFDEAIKIAEY